MQIPSEIYKLKSILDTILGSSKSDLNDSFQLQYPCPRCVENKGAKEATKYNLEINLRKGVFQCWSCSAHDDEMHGSILKLLRLYGNDAVIEDYKQAVKALSSSKLYLLSFDKNDFNIEFSKAETKEVELPKNFVKFEKKKFYPKEEYRALQYLKERGIGWDVIEKHNMGFTVYDNDNWQVSNRIMLPSHNKYGELNYWTGRDITTKPHRQKYFNPTVDRKSIIFNEDLVNWDADITLVEGPFDHIVVPNSIPLLGKVLKSDFQIFSEIVEKANGNVNVFLDGDAFEDVKKVYKLLNQTRLYNKIRYIPTDTDLDPSEIYQKYGYKGIIQALKGASKINEVYLM